MNDIKYTLTYNVWERMPANRATIFGRAIVNEGKHFSRDHLKLRENQASIKGCFKWGQLLLVYTNRDYQIYKLIGTVIKNGVLYQQYDAISDGVSIRYSKLFD